MCEEIRDLTHAAQWRMMSRQLINRRDDDDDDADCSDKSLHVAMVMTSAGHLARVYTPADTHRIIHTHTDIYGDIPFRNPDSNTKWGCVNRVIL